MQGISQPCCCCCCCWCWEGRGGRRPSACGGVEEPTSLGPREAHALAQRSPRATKPDSRNHARVGLFLPAQVPLVSSSPGRPTHATPISSVPSLNRRRPPTAPPALPLAPVPNPKTHLPTPNNRRSWCRTAPRLKPSTGLTWRRSWSGCGRCWAARPRSPRRRWSTPSERGLGERGVAPTRRRMAPSSHAAAAWDEGAEILRGNSPNLVNPFPVALSPPGVPKHMLWCMPGSNPARECCEPRRKIHVDRLCGGKNVWGRYGEGAKSHSLSGEGGGVGKSQGHAMCRICAEREPMCALPMHAAPLPPLCACRPLSRHVELRSCLRSRVVVEGGVPLAGTQPRPDVLLQNNSAPLIFAQMRDSLRLARIGTSETALSANCDVLTIASTFPVQNRLPTHGSCPKCGCKPRQRCTRVQYHDRHDIITLQGGRRAA